MPAFRSADRTRDLTPKLELEAREARSADKTQIRAPKPEPLEVRQVPLVEVRQAVSPVLAVRPYRPGVVAYRARVEMRRPELVLRHALTEQQAARAVSPGRRLHHDLGAARC